MIVVLFVILLSGLGLYVLLKPSVNSREQAKLVKEERFAELKLSSIPLPEQSKLNERTLATGSPDKE